MKRLLLILVAMAGVVAGAGVLSPSARMLINSGSTARKAPGDRVCRVIMTVDHYDASVCEMLADAGGVVESHAGDVVVARVPVSRLEALALCPVVQCVEAEREVEPATLIARGLTNVDKVHAGTGLKRAFTGKGVVVGVIDTGFEFNHIAFKDASGNSRIKAVYLPGVTDGTSPVFGDETLPGSHYTTAEQIAALTCDTERSTHGTHTASTAAGTIIDGLGGMAPDADIVLCGLGDRLTDANILNSMFYIASIAEQLDEPYVISISIGSNDGPHNGLTGFNRYIDAISDDGGIVVISTGNDGNKKMHLSHTFSTDDEQVASILSTISYTNAGMTAWSAGGEAFSGRLELIKLATGELVYAFPEVTDDGYVLSADPTSEHYDEEFATYFTTATIAQMAAGQDAQTGTHTVQGIVVGDLTVDKSSYRLAMRLTGKAGTRVDAWPFVSDHQFTSHGGMTGYVDGDNLISVSDMACAPTAITVGAYIGANSYTGITGQTYTQSNYTPIGDVGAFSSYGTDLGGQVHPTITAPGTQVLAAVSSYCTTFVSDNAKYANKVTVDGTDYYYGAYSGTSMSTPVVAGIVALMLELNPKLTAGQVKTLLQSNATHDSYTAAKSARFGGGKVDAMAVMAGPTTGVNDVKMGDAPFAAMTADGSIVVVLPTGATGVTIYDISGRQVGAATGVDGVARVEGLPHGVYVAVAAGHGVKVVL